jgi:hypothetical protein
MIYRRMPDQPEASRARMCGIGRGLTAALRDQTKEPVPAVRAC